MNFRPRVDVILAVWGQGMLVWHDGGVEGEGQEWPGRGSRSEASMDRMEIRCEAGSCCRVRRRAIDENRGVSRQRSKCAVGNTSTVILKSV